MVRLNLKSRRKRSKNRKVSRKKSIRRHSKSKRKSRRRRSSKSRKVSRRKRSSKSRKVSRKKSRMLFGDKPAYGCLKDINNKPYCKEYSSMNRCVKSFDKPVTCASKKNICDVRCGLEQRQFNEREEKKIKKENERKQRDMVKKMNNKISYYACKINNKTADIIFDKYTTIEKCRKKGHKICKTNPLLTKMECYRHGIDKATDIYKKWKKNKNKSPVDNIPYATKYVKNKPKDNIPVAKLFKPKDNIPVARLTSEELRSMKIFL